MLAVLTGRTPVHPAVLPTGAPLLPAALRRLACDTTFSLIVHQHLTAAAAGTTGAGAVGASQAAQLASRALVRRQRACGWTCRRLGGAKKRYGSSLPSRADARGPRRGRRPSGRSV